MSWSCWYKLANFHGSVMTITNQKQYPFIKTWPSWNSGQYVPNSELATRRIFYRFLWSFADHEDLKKTPDVFLELNFIRIFTWCKRTKKKNGSSAMASTDYFLSFVCIKEHRCFLLKTHWSDYYWKLNAKAANLFHGIWLQKRKQRQLCGNLHIFPLAGRRLHTELWLQTNQPELDEAWTDEVSLLWRQRLRQISGTKPYAWKYKA